MSIDGAPRANEMSCSGAMASYRTDARASHLAGQYDRSGTVSAVATIRLVHHINSSGLPGLDQPSWVKAPSSARSSCRSYQPSIKKPCLTRATLCSSMVSSLDSGSLSQLTARYQARSTHGPALPGQPQSSSTVRPSGSEPRLPSFQSPCTKVAGVVSSAATSG